MNERDRAAADDWMRDLLPDPDEYSLEDSEEQGDTQKYFFLRHRDSATVVYKVAVKDGKDIGVENAHSSLDRCPSGRRDRFAKPA